MARKKRKSHHRPRRRMGALSGNLSNSLMTMGGVVAGAVLSRFVDNIIAKQTTVTIDPKVLQFGKILAGGFAAYKMANPLLKGIGMGLAAEGAVSELVAMKVLTGIGRVNPNNLQFPQLRNLNGPGKSQTNLPTVGSPAVAPSTVGRSMYRGIY